jgi:hypothetical protein
MNLETVVEPVVTLPPDVQDFVTEEYARAGTILEYGSGGSTVVAAQAGARTFTVESDAAWGRNIERWLDSRGLGQNVTLHLADIGPTGAWGKPERTRLVHARRYLRYPHSVWDRPDFRKPDVILVDGRFRVACFLAALARIERRTRLLFDDYAGRTDYHVVEGFQKPLKMIDRMAVFDLEPRTISSLDWVLTLPARLDPA